MAGTDPETPLPLSSSPRQRCVHGGGVDCRPALRRVLALTWLGWIGEDSFHVPSRRPSFLLRGVGPTGCVCDLLRGGVCTPCAGRMGGTSPRSLRGPEWRKDGVRGGVCGQRGQRGQPVLSGVCLRLPQRVLPCSLLAAPSSWPCGSPPPPRARWVALPRGGGVGHSLQHCLLYLNKLTNGGPLVLQHFHGQPIVFFPELL